MIPRHWEFGSDEKERERGREKEKLNLTKNPTSLAMDICKFATFNKIKKKMGWGGTKLPPKGKNSVRLSFELSQITQNATDQI